MSRTPLLVAALAALSACPAAAQNFATAGGNWSSTWGFGSASDRSVALQQAQIISQRENPAGPSTVITYHNYYDNRANYIENNAGGSTNDLHIGDEIGQQTYSVGALNTGHTTITVEGSNNTISSVNSAESNGCVDGSIATVTTNAGGGAWAGSASETAYALPYLDTAAIATRSASCR